MFRKLLFLLAGLGVLAAAGSATAQNASSSDEAARTRTVNGFERKNGVMRNEAFAFSVRAGTNEGSGAKVVASSTISVNAATKSKYGLASAVIMKGSTSTTDMTPQDSSGVVWRVKSTRAVARKLKGVTTLRGVTFTVKYTSPVTETVTKKVDFYGGANASKAKILYLSSSGDTHVTEGGGRG